MTLEPRTPARKPCSVKGGRVGGAQPRSCASGKVEVRHDHFVASFRFGYNWNRYLDENDPLVDSWILQVEDERNLWYSKIHHVALDGFGAMTMVNRIAALYSAAHEDRAPEPPTAADLHSLYRSDLDYRGSSRYTSDRDYWIGRVAGLEDGSTLARRTAPTAARSTLDSVTLPDDLVARLTDAELHEGKTVVERVHAPVLAISKPPHPGDRSPGPRAFRVNRPESSGSGPRRPPLDAV